MTDGLQGMLFATTADTADEPADGEATGSELRICALNVNSPSVVRAQHLLDWMLATKCNTLILTEMQPNEGGRLILTGLEAEGFSVSCTTGWQASRHMATVAIRGFSVAAVHPTSFDPRVVTADLRTGKQTVRIVGVYAPTNGMTPDSSTRRRDFQRRLLDHLSTINNPALCVAGDLNVIEPGHRPSLPGFEAHDYAFYTGLVSLGLRDAYRALNPDGSDHSWTSPRLGSQRLDHMLISPATGTLRECGYDHTPRTERLTDHAALLTTVGLDAST